MKKIMAQQAINSPKAQQNKGTPTKNRGTPPTSKTNKNPNCVLCKGFHWIKNHIFNTHGNFSHQYVFDTLRSNKICFRCALPYTPTHQYKNCSNVLVQCEHCSTFNHASICCKYRKNAPMNLPRVQVDPKNQNARQTNSGNQPELVQID